MTKRSSLCIPKCQLACAAPVMSPCATSLGSTSQGQVGETHLAASIERQQPTAGQRHRPNSRHHLDQRGINRHRSLPIALTKPRAASSFRGLSTRAAISWQSTSHHGPHRKTFRRADLRRTLGERPLFAGLPVILSDDQATGFWHRPGSSGPHCERPAAPRSVALWSGREVRSEARPVRSHPAGN